MEEEKYPENYFEHYIACFSSTHQTLNQAGFENLAKLYIEIEGSDEFSELINEIELIKENDDWAYFEERARDFEIQGLTVVKLKEMAEVAIKIGME
ncbi:hypothetical protein A8990_102143 [Paenibacillus taihuensis]|uniref:CdiI immunity protein domain-containing protein n=1 Tax=Paenibacillus taihuensis TaxID=1156355 RepID=A0A3D9SEP0_9BACL|nr:hypothetical protein [Paenibacillus taihuensis]REE93057.1 hypothetical protein A8990_102143 [Paenibacillus taihuensis]